MCPRRVPGLLIRGRELRLAPFNHAGYLRTAQVEPHPDGVPISPSPTQHATHIALKLAEKTPSAMLPCPVCAVSVRGENLKRHLSRVHPEHTAHRADGPLRFRGKDGLIALELFVLFGATGVVSLILLFLLGLQNNPLAMSALALMTLGGLLGIVLAGFGLFPAWIRFHEGKVTLQYGLGLRWRTLSKIDGLAVGRLWRNQPASLTNQTDHPGPYHKVDAGMSLTLGQGWRKIRVRYAGGTAFRKHWAEDDYKQGGRGWWWDIEFPREQAVALEYVLADQGLLHLRKR